MLLYRRHTLAPVGIGLLALGLADRLAFFSPLGAAAIVAGVVLLAAAALAPNPPGADHLGYPPLLVALCVFTALAPLVPGVLAPAATAPTLAGGRAFLRWSPVPAPPALPPWPRRRPLVPAPPAIILRVP